MLGNTVSSGEVLCGSVTILDVLDHYGITDTLYRAGNTLGGACPLHNGKSPTCFVVSLSRNRFDCFGKCKVGGGVIDFVSIKERVSRDDAALLIKKWFPSIGLSRSQ